MSIKLNEQQLQVVEALKDPSLKGFTLTGEGGTGKTTCIMKAVLNWKAEGKKVIMLAPTNKAVKQIQQTAKWLRVPVDAMTIHKALGLALLPTNENKYTHKMGASILGAYDVAVIDEAGMISKIALFEYLLPELTANDVIPVFMGDAMQLPPVKETKSEALGVYPGMELTQVERFESGSGIAQLTTMLRGSIRNGTHPMLNLTTMDITRIPQANFDKEVCKLFKTNTTDKTRVLAWTNARVTELNRKIRQSIYGNDAPIFAVGEKVVMGAPVYDEFGQCVMSSDEEGTVTALSESTVTSPESNEVYPVWVVAVTPDGTKNTTVFCNVLKLNAYDKLEDELSEYKKKALETGNSYWWKKYHEIKDLFADVKYCYCITVHRSQGSTFETVAVDVANIMRNYIKDERKKLLYVACSRASKTLIVNQGKVQL